MALTDSGSTALWMSRHRIHIPHLRSGTSCHAAQDGAVPATMRPLLMDTSAEARHGAGSGQGAILLAHPASYSRRCLRHHLQRRAMGQPGGYQYAQDLRGGEWAWAAMPRGRGRHLRCRRLLLDTLDEHASSKAASAFMNKALAARWRESPAILGLQAARLGCLRRRAC